MAEQRNYLYSLVRYVPDVITGEYVNIGAVVRDPEIEGRVNVRFTADWTRLQVVFPEADVELLEAVAREVSAELPKNIVTDGKSLLSSMASWSNCLQVTEPKGMYAESMESGLEHLFYLYVRPSAGWPPQRKAEAS